MASQLKTFIISAYACEPDEGSEPGVGWNWSVELAKRNKVIVITRENNRKKIEKAYSKRKFPNLSFYYCDVPPRLSFWKKGQRGVHLYYWVWQFYCYKLAKDIVKEYDVDYGMALTFGNVWLPTFMYKLPCDFIWGPLGGGEGVPKVLWSHISLRQQITEKIRRINILFPITNPWKNAACKKARLIIVRTKDTLACISDKYKNKCKLIIETGISNEDIMNFKRIELFSRKKEKKDFMICGKMVPYKMFDLAIDAFYKAKAINRECKLHVVGDGPMRKKLLVMVEMYHLENQVIFHGELSREETLKLMASCKALLLTSAREGGSWVMFEAMLLKKPIICFDTSGMSVVVNNETGFMVPITEYNNAVKKFANILENCDDLICEIKGQLAYQRVIENFTWESKILQLTNYLN